MAQKKALGFFALKSVILLEKVIEMILNQTFYDSILLLKRLLHHRYIRWWSAFKVTFYWNPLADFNWKVKDWEITFAWCYFIDDEIYWTKLIFDFKISIFAKSSICFFSFCKIKESLANSYDLYQFCEKSFLWKKVSGARRLIRF